MDPLVLSNQEVQQLQALAHATYRSLQNSIVKCAQLVSTCGASETNTAIARRLGVMGMTGGK